MQKLSFPYKNLLPPLSTQEFEALAASIKNNGIREPIIVDEKGNILDGYHRYKICPNAPTRVMSNLTDAEKQAFVFQANLARRNLSPEQKKAIRTKMQAIAKALRMENPRKNTESKIAALLGVSIQTISVWLGTNSNIGNSSLLDARVKVPPKARPKLAERFEKKESIAQIAADYGISEKQVRNIAKKEIKLSKLKIERQKTVKNLGLQSLNVYCEDFRQGGNKIKENSIDLIFTDPPYDQKSVFLYAELAAFAARVLRPGGWCLAYAGNSFMYQAQASLAEKLTYGWTFAIVHKGGGLRFRKYKLQNEWKPILGFYKPPLEAWWNWFCDTIGGTKDKSDHKWQQPIEEAQYFIRALCPDGGIVCDPMCGTGTTCQAAKRLNRQWIAFEIDPKMAEIARAKIENQTHDDDKTG